MGVATILALSGAPALVKLSLFSCPLAERGVVALASELSKGRFSSLRELVVSGCGVTLTAAEALMQALASGSGQCLKVRHCGQRALCPGACIMHCFPLKADSTAWFVIKFVWDYAFTGAAQMGMINYAQGFLCCCMLLLGSTATSEVRRLDICPSHDMQGKRGFWTQHLSKHIYYPSATCNEISGLMPDKGLLRMNGMCCVPTQYIEIGANPACETADAMTAAVEALVTVRPDMEVLWHASNQQPGGGNEEKPTNDAAAAAAAADAAQ